MLIHCAATDVAIFQITWDKKARPLLLLNGLFGRLSVYLFCGQINDSNIRTLSGHQNSNCSTNPRAVE
jgi:hypothetical protein